MKKGGKAYPVKAMTFPGKKLWLEVFIYIRIA